MNNYLKLYDEPELVPVETIAPNMPNSSCMLCALNENAQRVCLPPEGDAGGLLVIGDHPAKSDDLHGRIFATRNGSRFRQLLLQHWDGAICVDNAIKCYPTRNITDRMMKICRTYLAQTIYDSSPERILVCGPLAMKAVLDRSAPPLAIRRGFGWLEKTGTPVFCLMPPDDSFDNRFLKQWFEDDLKWALTADVDELRTISSKTSCAAMIQTSDESKQAVKILRDAEWVAYDTETVGQLFNKDFEVVSIAITAKDHEDCFVWSGNALKDSDTLQPVLQLLTDENTRLVAQNAKYDSNAMYSAYGVAVNKPHLDTCLLRKIFEPESSAKLSVMQELVGMGGGKEIAENAISSVTRKISKAKSAIDLASIGPLEWTQPIAEKKVAPGVYAYGLIDSTVRDRYCGRDAVSTARLAELFESRLANSPNLDTVWREIMQPVAGAIEYVERWGVGVSRSNIQSFHTSVSAQLENVIEILYRDGAWNINSTNEMGEFLYKKHRLPVVKKTATGVASTDKATLEALARKRLNKEQSAIVQALLDYRKLNKLMNTYSSRFESFIRDDNRVHPSFNLTGARSGRISCSNPNVQQIPRASSELGAMARGCFVAPRGRTLVQLDYSQLELRVVAMLSQDENMIDVFKSGADYHLRTAQLISKAAWGIEEHEVQKTHRTAAKSVNFGLLYGMGLSTLAKNIGCTVPEAERIQNAVFGSFPKLKRWCDQQLKIARTEGVTYTYWNGDRARVRPMFNIASKDDYTRSKAEHGSWNTPVQGSASDFCLASLARCVDFILKNNYPAKLVLTVHDSLLFEVDEKKSSEFIDIIRHLMTDWPTHGVPILVDAEIGDTWGELEEIK